MWDHMRSFLTAWTYVAFGLIHGQEHAWVYTIEGQPWDIPNHTRSALVDGGVLICGLNYYDTTFSALRLSATGEVVWYQALSVSGVGLSHVPSSCHELPDGGLMMLAPAAPITNSPHELLLLRLEPTGAPLWAKRFTIPDLIGPGYKHAKMHGLGDGTSIIYLDQDDAYSILRVSGEGVVLSFRTYVPDVPGNLSTHDGDDALVHADDDGMLVARNTSEWLGLEFRDGVVVTMLNAAGSVQWCSSYYFGDGARVLDMVKGLDDTYLMTGQTYELGTLNTFGLRIGSTGEVLWRRNYWHPGLWAGYGGDPTAIPNSEFVLQYHGHVLHLDPDGSIVSDLVNMDGMADVWGNIVEVNDQQLRFIGVASCIVPGWTSLHGALDMKIPLDQGADCAPWDAGNLLDTVATVDSIVSTATSVSEMPLSMTDQSISSAPLVVTRQALCDFADGIGPVPVNTSVVPVVVPTPSQGRAVLRLAHAASGTFQVTVRDQFGRPVLSTWLPVGSKEVDLDLTDHAPGLYVVQLAGGGRNYTARTVVQ